MYAMPEQFAASNKAILDSLLSVASSAFNSAERLASLNLNAARAALEDSVDTTKDLLAIKDVQELVAKQKSMAKPGLDKVVSYSRSVYEIGAESQEALSKMVESQYAALNKTVIGALDKIATSSAPGSDVAVTAVKSAMSAANSAYESFTAAAKQVAAIAEANVASVTNAAVKVAGGSGPTMVKTKKAA